MNPEEEKIPSLPEEGKSCRPEVPEEKVKAAEPKRPLKVIISQPMKGKPEAQIRSERAELVRAINNAGDVVVDTIFPDFPEGKNVPLKFLARSLEAIADVDKVVFMKGWEHARGCKIEHTCCVEYGIEVLCMQD